MNNPQSQTIVNRFFEALAWLIGEHYLRGEKTFCDRYGLNRRNLYALRKNPASDMFQPSWLAILVDDFGISASWLLTGRGDMVARTLPSTLRAQAYRNRPRKPKTSPQETQENPADDPSPAINQTPKMTP